MNPGKYTSYIEKYLGGEMDSAEELWFRKEIEGNDDLYKEIELRQKTENFLRDQPIIDLRRKLASIESNRARKVSETIKPEWKSILRYAAAACLLIIAGTFVFFNDYHQDNDKIIEKYYKPYKVTSASRTGLSETSRDYDLAIDFYNNHDYKNAAIYLGKVVIDEPGNMHSALLNGVAGFENGDYEEAKRSLQMVIKDNNNLYIDHARWYLALCYVKTNEYNSAIELLVASMDSGNIYRKKAGQVLRLIKKIK